MDENQQAHVAEVLPNTKARLFAAKDAEVPPRPTTPEGWQDGAVLRSFAFLQNPHEPWYDTMNSPRWREVEIASGSGHGNARGVARIYGATVGEVDGISLLSQDQLERMITEQHNQVELLQDRPYHQASGRAAQHAAKRSTWAPTCAASAITGSAARSASAIPMRSSASPIAATRCTPSATTARARGG